MSAERSASVSLGLGGRRSGRNLLEKTEKRNACKLTNIRADFLGRRRASLPGAPGAALAPTGR
eukprot:6077965-Pyramimonas_sp.AAC.1